MAARNHRRPEVKPALLAQTTDDRAVNDLGERLRQLTSRTGGRVQLVADLVVGANVINHGLGRRAVGVNLTPTAASAAFAWAMTAADAKQVTITVVGVAQPKASLEVY
jgi:hypothetical protein